MHGIVESRQRRRRGEDRRHVLNVLNNDDDIQPGDVPGVLRGFRVGILLILETYTSRVSMTCAHTPLTYFAYIDETVSAYRRVNGEGVHRLRLEIQFAVQHDHPARLRRRLSLPNGEQLLRLLER